MSFRHAAPAQNVGAFLLCAGGLWFWSNETRNSGTAHDRRTTEAFRLGPRRRRHDRGGGSLRARPLSREASVSATSTAIAVADARRISRCARRASRRRPRSRAILHDRDAMTAPRTHMARPIPTTCAAMLGDSPARPTRWPIRATRQRYPAVMDWAGSVGAVADAVRRRIERGGRRRAARRRRRYKAAVTLDLRQLGRVLEVDRTSRAALHPGRRVRSGAGGPAAAARAHAAAFPAELRVFHARAAGSRRARAGISRRSTRISTISSKACAW